MRDIIKNKLFLLVKLCIFTILAMAPLLTYAEYYLVYSTSEYNDLCVNCHTSSHKQHHRPQAKRSPHHHYRSHHFGSLSVSYPIICHCCSQPHFVRSQWGDYVVFTSRPADRRHGIPETTYSYSPDLRTADDRHADLEIN